MELISRQEIAGLSLSEACIQQERLNSRLAVADSKLRKVRSERREQLLREDKQNLEELYMALSEHIEELIIS